MNKPLFFWGILLLSVLHLRAKTATNVAPGLDAEFTSDVTVVCAGDSVHFFDQTTENPTGWTWTFDGGTPNTSLLQNPVVAYNTPGVYTVHLKSNNGDEGDEETKTEYIKVLFTPSSTFNITSAVAQCNNSNSYSFVNTGSSGTHFWGFPGGSPINSSATNPGGVVFTGPGTHVVSHKVTDDGCSSTTLLSITIFSSPTALAVTTSASNCAGSTGTISIGAVTSGTAPFTYSVNGSSFTSQTSYTGFAPGTYSVTVKDANGCTFTRTAIVGSSGGPTAIGMVVTPATCSTANGIINIISVTGGVSPYQYSVDNSAFSFQQSYSNLALGIHQVRVKDANGCLFTQAINILNTQPTAVVTTTTATGCATPNGTLTLGAVTGGRSPYSFSVDGGAFTSTTNYTGLAAGTHTIVVKDITGCSLTTSVTITTTPGPTAFATTNTPSACATPTGSINAQNPVGGTAPYTFSFNGGTFTTTHLFTGLAAGTYTVVVKDANGCTVSQTINVGNTPSPTAIAITTNASACSASTGAVTLGAVTGGTAPYTYAVDGSSFTTATSYTNLAAGTHTVVVKDANGCTFTTTATIGNTQPTNVVLTPTAASCNATGSLTIGAVTGGVAPFVYSVNSSAFTSATVYNNRPAGTYTVAVKDFNGCVLTQTVTINSTTPTALALTTTVTACGSNTGTVTIGAVTGGVSPFTYSFNGSAFTATTNYSSLAAGVYTVTVKDATNCTFTTSVTVSSNGGPTGLVVNQTPATCGNANGSVTIGGLSGGTAPFTYALDNGAFTSSISFTNVAGGIHTVRVQDVNGCIFAITITIVNASGPTDVALTSTNATCGNANAIITVGAVTGGTAPFTYSLDGGTFTSATSYSSLAAGSHTITVKDANNCTLVKTRTIADLAAPAAIVFNARATGCSSPLNSGSVSVSGLTGGSAPFTYSFNGSAFTSTTSYTSLAAGTYTLIAKDANGCTVSQTITIGTVPHGPSAFTATEVDPSCGQNNGSVVINSVTAGTPPYQYKLGSSSFTNSNSFTGLVAGSYPLNIRDANGCETGFGGHPVLSSPGGPSGFSHSTTTATCQQANGTITVTSVTGGVAPYQYALNGGPFQNSATFNAVLPGTSVLVIRDANGCTFSTSLGVNNAGIMPGVPFITQNGFLLSSSASSAYQWFLNGVAIAGATGQTHFAAVNGSYTVVRISGGCTSAPSAPVVITNQSSRLAGPDDAQTPANVESSDARTEEPQALNISETASDHTLVAYPNPNEGTFTLSFTASENTVYTIEVFNVFGQVVFAEQVSGAAGLYTKQLDLSEYGAGIYTVILTGGQERSVEKIVTH